MTTDIYTARRAQLQKAVIDAALALCEHEGAAGFNLPIKGTTPPISVTMGMPAKTIPIGEDTGLPLYRPVGEQDLQAIEQYRMQMAAISTAAIGYWTEADGILPDYDTVPLRDVARLYAKYAELHRAAPPEGQEAPVACGACQGSGWVPRDPDIGTEQECFSCNGSGVDEEEAVAPRSLPVEAGEVTELRERVAELEKVIAKREAGMLRMFATASLRTT